MTSKYDRLVDHLAAIGAATITLTFAEVEAIVGPLPPQARRAPEWCGATPAGRYMYTHAMNWWQAGYIADRPELPTRPWRERSEPIRPPPKRSPSGAWGRDGSFPVSSASSPTRTPARHPNAERDAAHGGSP